MHYIAFPSDETRRLTFYLAAEEYVSRRNAIDEYFFMWQVEPTVVFGRNQLIDSEVNLPYCREHGIAAYRRKSGGGCVYADMNNIMFSYGNRGEHVTLTFERHINRLVDMLNRLGIKAYTSGRNDILVDGKKVSGNAFYHIPGRNILHGTMLFDTNWQHMVGSITPSQTKLVSKGVESVRQHVTVLKDFCSLTIDEFKAFARDHLCDQSLTLTDEDVRGIEAIEREYLDPAFIFGNNPRYTLTQRRRIEGCGEFEVRMELRNNVIKAVELKGDFFLVGELDALLARFKNVERTPEALQAAVADCDLTQYIMHLTRDALIELLVE
ncbi:MAG: lipoyltransferase [Bacteroidaceae bacterium]|nr:lipoyltransferase [Bacteroidaceae bacterium]